MQNINFNWNYTMVKFFYVVVLCLYVVGSIGAVVCAFLLDAPIVALGSIISTTMAYPKAEKYYNFVVFDKEL